MLVFMVFANENDQAGLETSKYPMFGAINERLIRESV